MGWQEAVLLAGPDAPDVFFAGPVSLRGDADEQLFYTAFFSGAGLFMLECEGCASVRAMGRRGHLLRRRKYRYKVQNMLVKVTTRAGRADMGRSSRRGRARAYRHAGMPMCIRVCGHGGMHSRMWSSICTSECAAPCSARRAHRPLVRRVGGARRRAVAPRDQPRGQRDDAGRPERSARVHAAGGGAAQQRARRHGAAGAIWRFRLQCAGDLDTECLPDQVQVYLME